MTLHISIISMKYLIGVAQFRGIDQGIFNYLTSGAIQKLCFAEFSKTNNL